MLIEQYGVDDNGAASPTARRYSPNKVTGEDVRVITGNPDGERISTSYVERQNLTMRMSIRRFTRLTNGFSKKVENLAASVALHYMHYNFARPHSSLGRNTTPAMAAGIRQSRLDGRGDRRAARLSVAGLTAEVEAHCGPS